MRWLLPKAAAETAPRRPRENVHLENRTKVHPPIHVTKGADPVETGLAKRLPSPIIHAVDAAPVARPTKKETET